MSAPTGRTEPEPEPGVLREPDFDTERPFTRADAMAAGIAPRLLRGSGFRSIFRGVYVSSRVGDSPRLRAAAALALFDRTAFASHASAARVHDLPIPVIAEEHVSVLKSKHRRASAGITCHLQATATVRVVDGLRVSDYRQVFVELGSLVGLVDLVVVGDNLVRKGRVTPAELVAHCRSSKQRGARAALRAALHVRDGVDSPMETRLRMLLMLAGIPEPLINPSVIVAGQLRRFDLCWREVKVVVEYDGRHHIEREAQWEEDLDRREEIDDDGWRILVVTSRGIYREPERTVLRVWQLLRDRALAGVPTRPASGWRPHFIARG